MISVLNNGYVGFGLWLVDKRVMLLTENSLSGSDNRLGRKGTHIRAWGRFLGMCF